ncbi:hypothetical protein KY329_04830 [Candidatus Woesearchaeota archaeon]|nr:hypothetical protein [Candidatus Woesearchaeota archaeon]
MDILSALLQLVTVAVVFIAVAIIWKIFTKIFRGSMSKTGSQLLGQFSALRQVFKKQNKEEFTPIINAITGCENAAKHGAQLRALWKDVQVRVRRAAEELPADDYKIVQGIIRLINDSLIIEQAEQREQPEKYELPRN